MAVAPNGPIKEVATHYEVLGITPSILDEEHDASALLKKAYHRALLRHHPDKTAAVSASSNQVTASRTSSGSLRSAPAYTVDQITTAFTSLASPSQRAAYDASLRLSSSSDERLLSRFQTGVENVDLDDLAFDEAGSCWYRSCRCGNEKGYVLTEGNLEDAGDDGELMVGCSDCSLWLRVHFAVIEEEDDQLPAENAV